MTRSTAQLIDQLADSKQRNSARTELIKRGKSIVSELLSKLEAEIGLSHRKTIMRILLEIKDKRAEELFRKSLHSDDEDIRAISARGLYLLGAEDALDACLATINDSPDMLHFDSTPSVMALSEMGLPVLHSILPLLSSEDKRTRQRAQKVFEGITYKEILMKTKPSPSSSKARITWQVLWEKNGSYQWDAPEDQRKMAIKRWEEWLKEYAQK